MLAVGWNGGGAGAGDEQETLAIRASGASHANIRISGHLK
jgi:hypothetical protein